MIESNMLADPPNVANAAGYTKKSFDITEFDVTSTSSVVLNFVDVSKLSPAYFISVFFMCVLVVFIPLAHLR